MWGCRASGGRPHRPLPLKKSCSSGMVQSPKGSGHLTVKLNGKKTQLPTHGQKELGTGLVDKIKKDLGLK